MSKIVVAALIVGAVGLVAHRVWAQDDPRAERATVFMHARDAAYQVVVSRHGVVMAAMVLPKGTILSARDNTHTTPNHVGQGRFEFSGNFELRGTTEADVPPEVRNGMPGPQMLRNAPMLLAIKDVDVVIERTAQ